MNRRTLLAGAGAAGAGAWLSACAPSASGPSETAADPLSGQSLMKDVEAYVSFGVHNSGGAGDVATSAWLADHWRSLGFEIEQPAFQVPRAQTTLARLEAGGQIFDGFAQPPLALTPPEGVSAELALFDAAAPEGVAGRLAIIFVPRERNALSPAEAYRQAAAAAAAAGARGVIIAVSSPSGEVAAINTPPDATFPIPVLMLPQREKARLEAAIRQGPATLRIEGPGGLIEARNTIARYGAAGPWVIVSTPQSGWFTCGGERGPGVAMSRALSAWALRQSFACRWLFIATSGHEWTDTGAHMFHQTSAPDPSETALWLHLGASFGARGYEETDQGLRPLETPNPTRSFMVSEDMAPFARRAFEGQPVISAPLLADAATARGEIRLAIAEGYPSTAGFWGAHALFHDPTDDASATSPQIMEPIARALAAMLQEKLKAL